MNQTKYVARIAQRGKRLRKWSKTGWIGKFGNSGVSSTNPRVPKTLTSGGLSNYGGVSRSGCYRANAVGSGRRAVSESAPRVGGFAVRGKPPPLEPLLCRSLLQRHLLPLFNSRKISTHPWILLHQTKRAKLRIVDLDVDYYQQYIKYQRVS